MPTKERAKRLAKRLYNVRQVNSTVKQVTDHSSHEIQQDRAGPKRQYYTKNIQNIRFQQTQYHGENKEKIGLQRKQHYRENQATIGLQKKSHYRDNQATIGLQKK